MANRIQAILSELERSRREYVEAKEQLDTARAIFETAREKFATVKRLASEMLPWIEWYEWEQQHQDVALAGMPIGEAILSILRTKTAEAAFTCAANPEAKFDPDMILDEIVEALESRGFEFRSATPGREVNAALINLEGVKKGRLGAYRAADADETLKVIMEIAEAQKDKQKGSE